MPELEPLRHEEGSFRPEMGPARADILLLYGYFCVLNLVPFQK